jgi:hypothetical protein
MYKIKQRTDARQRIKQRPPESYTETTKKKGKKRHTQWTA